MPYSTTPLVSCTRCTRVNILAGQQSWNSLPLPSPGPSDCNSVKTVQREHSEFTVDLKLALVNLVSLEEKCLNGAGKA